MLVGTAPDGLLKIASWPAKPADEVNPSMLRPTHSRFLSWSVSFVCLAGMTSAQDEPTVPDTGISGVYEVIVGAEDASELVRYFAEFGFAVVDEGALDEQSAESVYGVSSKLRSVRLQNGDIDSHGLLRILEWEKPLGPGVGYATPTTIGVRMAVMRTSDIFRLVDIYRLERDAGKPWLPIEPVYDDLYDMSDAKPGFFNRPAGVRETAVYGVLFNHVFFQRYGYQIPGYGTIGDNSPLGTSEFTHHDFMISGNSMEAVTDYYRDALGFKPEAEVSLDGEWQAGPRRVFDMEPGYSHYYRGFVSPNNICGKLKFFLPKYEQPDLSSHQRIGELGITLHSLYTAKPEMVRELLLEQGIQPTEFQQNEFGERGFVFRGPDGASWQILHKDGTDHPPRTELEFVRTTN